MGIDIKKEPIKALFFILILHKKIAFTLNF
jgi:hypothetical protein